MRICFVCSGNICRSPSAEIVMRALVADARLEDAIEMCSAGLGDWHVGQGTDRRSLEALTARGYDGTRHRARQFEGSWFAEHDLVVAMDRSHLRDLRRMAGPGESHRCGCSRLSAPTRPMPTCPTLTTADRTGSRTCST
jgi:protein-tyrosine phosphatase